ncbi:MAG: hypothetical protein H6819_00070 [Phycisphaerales bacterium]|nr:hypothetical protein [Phycisphaerales bacterium]MCB9857398.1 hypothetical protein [Phycisphaerales bacterium]MCB9864987.1 hypothetical protein [Phycisphaerales bacterium]
MDNREDTVRTNRSAAPISPFTIQLASDKRDVVVEPVSDEPDRPAVCRVAGRRLRLPERNGGQPLLLLAIHALLLVWVLIPVVGQRFANNSNAMVILLTLVLPRFSKSSDGPEDFYNLRGRLRNRRLAVLATEKDVETFTGLIDVPLEPVIIERLWSPIGRVRQLRIGALAAIIVYPIAIACGTPFSVLNLIALVAVLGILVIQLKMVLQPQYYRVVPGRLEHVQIRAWRRNEGCSLLSAWDLRESMVYVILGSVYVAPPAGLSSATVIHSIQTAEPRLLCLSIIHAAISTHVSPPLPVDRLYP